MVNAGIHFKSGQSIDGNLGIIFKVWLVGFVSAGFIGCKTIDPAEMEDGKTQYHIGLVKLAAGQSDPRITAIKVQTLGIVAAKGLAIGWRDSEKVIVPLKESEEEGRPWEATCGIVFIIASKAEAEHARNILGSLEGDNVCVTSF